MRPQCYTPAMITICQDDFECLALVPRAFPFTPSAFHVPFSSQIRPISTPKKIGEGLQPPQIPDARRQTPIKIKPNQTGSNQIKAKFCPNVTIYNPILCPFCTAPPTKSDQIRPKNDESRSPKLQIPGPRPQLALPISAG